MNIKKYLLLACCLLFCVMLSGCGSSSENGAPLSCSQIAEKAQSAASFVALTDVNESYLEKYLMIEADDLEEWVMRRDATRATPEMILVLKVKSGANQAEIKKAVQEYHEEQLLQYRDYQPAQVYKLEDAKVLENNSYIVLIVSPDASKVTTALV